MMLDTATIPYIWYQKHSKQRKIYKLDFIKIKHFYTSKDIINREKRQPVGWKKIWKIFQILYLI